MDIKSVSITASVFYLVAFLFRVLIPAHDLYIRFFDVGQGDSIFIRTAQNETILIDGGPNNEADNALQKEMPFPFCHLNYIILTHPHADHLLGLNKILKRCKVDIVTFNDVSYASEAWDDFRHLVEKNKVKNIFIGDDIKLNEVTIKILWPPSREFISAEIQNLNETSVVLFLDYGEFEVLFLGDLQEDFQQKLDIKSIKPLIQGRLDVLKVAHHGSINGLNMDLINELRPKDCVVSVGSDNKFGHPSPLVITKLKSSGCNVHRTDEEGDIVL